MKITKVESLKCGAGFRDFCFLKISTDGVSPDAAKNPIVGWSEYLDERNTGLDQCIEWMGQLVAGKDPLPYATIVSQLKCNTRHIVGGIANQAIAAIENALLDIVGKAYGVPVCALFGGPYRTELPVYWSHCGSFRVGFAEHLVTEDTKTPVPVLDSLDGIRALGEEVKRSGYNAIKTNIFHFDGEMGNPPPSMFMPGFGGGAMSPELNVTPKLVRTLVKQMKTFREACGDDIGLKLDLNYNFKTDGFIAIAKALTPEALGSTVGIDWLELDLYSPKALRQIRDHAAMPIASLESVMGRKGILPYLEEGAVDVCIVDTLWNGVAESVKMAELCDTFEVNCAAHNYHGWLGTAISAHFCAAIPNFKVLEVDVDDVPWKDTITTGNPVIKNGVLTLDMTRPGWGVEVDEAALKLHPPTNDVKSGIWSAAGAK